MTAEGRRLSAKEKERSGSSGGEWVGCFFWRDV